MVRTTTDDANGDLLPTKSEAFDIIDEARDFFDDDLVAATIDEHDGDLRAAAADLAQAVVDEEDRRQAEVRNDTRDRMTPTDAEVAAAFGVDDVDDITDEMLEDVDTSVPDCYTDTIDLSEYKTASGAAKAVGRRLKAIAEDVGHKPDVEVTVRREELRDGYKWVVYYPAGRHDWAVRMTGGDTVYGTSDPVFDGWFGSDGWQVECENGHALAFYPR